MSQAYSNCQSCGMPLKKDPGHGGTNEDGTHSTMYCSYCFDLGKFRNPNMTVTEMQAFSKDKLKSMGFPGFLAGMFTKGIPKLERWRSSSW